MADKFGFNRKDSQRIGDAVRKAESVQSFGAGKNPQTFQTPTIFARITADDGDGEYSWQQVINLEDGTWVDGSLSGSADDGNPAVELNGDGTEIDRRVILDRRPIVNDDKTISVGWVFQNGGSLPIGQYPGMTWIVVTNNQSAFAFPFAVQTV